MILRASFLLCLVALPAAVAAQPLTIRVGESWAFTLKNGQPANARRVKAAAKPARGQIKATLTGLGGTSLTITNNSPTSYTFRAEIVGARSKAGARTCTLPANMKPALEYWPQKATAVRLGNFRATNEAGSCPSPGN